MKRAYKHRVYAISIDTLINADPARAKRSFSDLTARWSTVSFFWRYMKFTFQKLLNEDIIEQNKEGRMTYEDFIFTLRDKLQLGQEVGNDEIVECWNATCQIESSYMGDAMRLFEAALDDDFSILIAVSKDPIQYAEILRQLNNEFRLRNMPGLEENERVILSKSFIEGISDESALVAKAIKKYNLDVNGCYMAPLEQKISLSKIKPRNMNFQDTILYHPYTWVDSFFIAREFNIPKIPRNDAVNNTTSLEGTTEITRPPRVAVSWANLGPKSLRRSYLTVSTELVRSRGYKPTTNSTPSQQMSVMTDAIGENPRTPIVWDWRGNFYYLKKGDWRINND